jgi:DNA-binding transcriptional regulator LsrR (DeoR family)
MLKRELPKLRPATEKFLKIMKYFDGKQITLLQYSYMLGVSRRRIRYMVSELRTKGYIRVIPENMKIHKSKACRYIFLDDDYIETPKYSIVNPEILKRLGIEDD